MSIRIIEDMEGLDRGHYTSNTLMVTIDPATLASSTGREKNKKLSAARRRHIAIRDSARVLAKKTLLPISVDMTSMYCVCVYVVHVCKCVFCLFVLFFINDYLLLLFLKRDY